MNDRRAERLAYFASLATPDLIVCATVERDSFSEEDRALIRDELFRRQIDPEKLALPGQGRQGVLGPTPESFSGPLPSAGAWWSASWDLFCCHKKFLALLTLVLFLPWYLMLSALERTHHWEFSIGLLANIFVNLAFDALVTTAVFRGLCRRMTRGHCSVGRAIAMGCEMWKHVFTVSLKASAIAMGLGITLIVLGRTSGEEGPAVIGIVALFYPGIYLWIRYMWVQPVAVLHPETGDPLAASKSYAADRYRRVFVFYLIGFGLSWVTVIGAAIACSLLPSDGLQNLVTGYLFAGFWVLTKVAVLVGYLHLISGDNGSPEAAPGAGETTADPAETEPPPPPSSDTGQ